MRRYETIFIASPVLTEEQVDDTGPQLRGDHCRAGWRTASRPTSGACKKLAYEVQKFSEGYYTLFEMNAGPSLIAELERRFRNHDSVIKFLSVRMDEQAKAAERQKVRYERESKRKAQAGIKERTLEEVMG